MWVIRVLSADRRRPIGARTAADLLAMCFGVRAVPETMTRKSSA